MYICDSPSDLEYTKVRSVKVPAFFGRFSTGLFTVEAARISKEADGWPMMESSEMRPLKRPIERSNTRSRCPAGRFVGCRHYFSLVFEKVNIGPDLFREQKLKMDKETFETFFLDF